MRNKGFLPIASTVFLSIGTSAGADQIDDYLRAQMAKNHIPAIAVAVVHKGKLAKLRSYGQANLEWNARTTPDTVFQLASATKPFTGLLLMRLVEQGHLTLDAPLTTFFPDAPAAWKQITVRHLATHQSGLSDDLGSGSLDTADQIVAAAMKQPLRYPPGTRSQYGFTDYVVLSRILEKVGGKSYPLLLKERITQPLGMDATTFNNEQEQGPIRVSDPLRRRAEVYQWQKGSQKVFDFLYGVPGYAAGGLYSSASDLARMFQGIEAGRLLNARSREVMWTRPTLTTGEPGEFGLGWVVRTYHGQKAVGHSGGPALADLLYFPDRQLAIVVLTNQQRLFPYLAEGIADLYLPATPMSKALEDSAPALTERLKSILAEAAEGRVNAEWIVPESQANLVPTLKEMGPMVIGVFDPVRRLDLIEEQKDTTKWVRKYRVMFGNMARYWLFVLSSEGKIVSMQPSSE